MTQRSEHLEMMWLLAHKSLEPSSPDLVPIPLPVKMAGLETVCLATEDGRAGTADLLTNANSLTKDMEGLEQPIS